MDRQMERSLFGNDSAIHEGAKETEATGRRPMETTVQRMDHKPRNANASKGTAITIEGLRDILILQDYRCALSGVVLAPDNAELDHIIPLSKGGSHSLDNLQIVHPVVNALKGQMTDEEFIGWARLIASNKTQEIDEYW